MHIAVPASDARALQLGAPAVIPSERHAVVTEDRPDGEEQATTLHIEVLAQSEEQAIDRASVLYTQARAAARLPAADAQVIGLMSPVLMVQPWGRCWNDARQHLLDGRSDLAVVRAQTALELFAVAAFEGICKRRLGERGLLLVRRFRASLADPTADLLEVLTGRRMKDCGWWQPYDLHRKRRNEILHQGVVVTPDQARTSLRIVEDARIWLAQLWAYGY